MNLPAHGPTTGISLAALHLLDDNKTRQSQKGPNNRAISTVKAGSECLFDSHNGAALSEWASLSPQQA